MATLFIAVWESATNAAIGKPIQEMSVSVGGASAQSAAIVGDSRRARYCRLFTDADCFTTWGENPTAQNDGSDGRPMGAGVTEYFNVEAGYKFATIERA